MGDGGLDWAKQPETYKQYPQSKRIPLPHPVSPATKELPDILQKRKSIRSYSHKPITIEQLSFLLWASTGIQRVEQGFEYRTAPSAGGLYPIETYLIVNNVEHLDPGIYHYAIKGHLLEVLQQGDFSVDIAQAALEQPMCADAAVVFIWTAIFNRSKWKYCQRAYRYIYLDVGHIAENLALTATGIGLGSCQIGALFDDEVNKLIDVDGSEESVIYMTTAGFPR
jgi:SagB-type dehydrogenase family enzyme